MDYYFIDYKTVNVSGLKGITKLPEEDTVIIFYSENANTITFGMSKQLHDAKAEIQFRKIAADSTGAMDMQLSACLGFTMRDNLGKDVTYYIVSNNPDYASLSTYWKRQKIDIVLISDIAGQTLSTSETVADSAADNAKKSSVLHESDELEKQLKALLPDKSQVSTVAEIIRKCKTRQEINVELHRVYHPGPGDTTVADIHKAIKPLIAGKPGAPERKDALERQLEEILPDKSQAPIVANILHACKTKVEINNALMKTYHPDHADKTVKEINKAIKPLIADLPFTVS